jgi:hypothetical protein
MQKRYIFSLAALALLTAACSSDEMALNPADQPAPVEQKIPFTAVISADAAGTRALTAAEDGKTITAKWEKKEKLALIHGKQIDVLEVSEVDATTGAATISGDITSPTNDESVFVVYVGHGSKNMSQLQESLTAVTEDIAEADISEAMNPMLMTQDGTLKGISDNFDFRLATAKFTVKDNKATFASEVKMPASYAIWKLNLTTDGTTALKAKQLSMQRKGDEEAHAAIYLDTETSSEFYIAFIPSAQANAYIFEATTSDDKTYSCTPTVSSALAVGKYYRSTLKMEAPTTYREYTAKDTYTDKKTPSNATTLTGTVTPGYLDGGTYVVSGEATCDGDLTFQGDADLILKDGASLTMTGAIVAEELTLNIYGQAEGTGKLSATAIRGSIAISAKNLNVHGGKITITDAYTGISTVSAFTIYNGIINSAGSNNGIIAKGPMNVYGGEITASSSGNGSAIYLDNVNCNLTIEGGKVTATNTGNLYGIDAVGGLKITGGTVTAQGGKRARGEGKVGIFTYGSNITISGGDVTAIGGDADAESNGDGGAGIYGVLTVNGGTVTATGGAKDGSGKDGLGISNDYTITLNGVIMYEGDSADPTTGAASQTVCTKRYVIIK